MPKPRLHPAIRSALARLQAGDDAQAVAAEVIRRRAERQLFRVELSGEDPRQPLLQVLIRALEARTFDDSTVTLEGCLQELQIERGDVDATAHGRP